MLQKAKKKKNAAMGKEKIHCTIVLTNKQKIEQMVIKMIPRW